MCLAWLGALRGIQNLDCRFAIAPGNDGKPKVYLR